MNRIITICMFSMLFASGCTIDPYTREEKVSHAGAGAGIGAGVGAATGAAIGAIAGGGEGALIGAAAGTAVGAGVGGGIGYYMDQQEAKLRQQLEGTGVSVQRQGENIKLIMPGNITFATNSSEISSSFYPVLNSVAQILSQFDKSNVDVTGFTDSIGNFEPNQILSEQRANSVAAYLINQGLNQSRVAARGMGERYPIAPNDTEQGRAQNRRVEISIRPNS